MAEKTIKRTLLSLFVLALACGTLLAQQPQSIHVTPFGDITIDRTEMPPSTITLFTNLGYSATDNYFAGNGWLVTGSTNTTYTTEQWVASKFQVKNASHVTMVQVAVGVLTGSSGTNEIDVALYDDDGTGNVGTIISPVKVVHNTPAFGTCCTLATAAFGTPGISIAANTNYWVVVTSDPNSTAYAGAWAFANPGLNSFNDAAAGWSGNAGLGGGNGAMTVKGTTP